MIKKHITKIRVLLALFTLSFFITSCNENKEEELFNQSPTERMKQREKELRDLLLSSEHGWKTVYFTDNNNLGGYTFLFNFLDESRVETIGNFNNNISPVESEYIIGLNTTTTLIFTTKSELHELSDSGNSAPLPNFGGSGYKGDFNFMYYGVENDEIIFKTSRDFVEVRFKKATAEDWTDFQKYQDMKDFLNNSSGHLAYENDGVVHNFSYNGNGEVRFATSLEGNSSLNFGVGFTSNGIEISPAIGVNGTKYSEFILNKTENKYTSIDGNFSISLVSSPIDMTVTWTTAARPAFSNQEFIDTFNTVKPIHDSLFPPFPLNDIYLLGGDEITFLIGSTSGVHGMSFSGVLGNEDLLAIGKLAPGRNWSLLPHLNPLVDLLVNKSPYKVQLINPDTAILTSDGDPDFVFTMIK
ncbi:DUF4302 domain-containing protein [Tenacibaculum discolor]|uniref:DUF4302 domain-containing protein n=1 Tax=Tenacibaculum discolor TaxID=361581 RepID=UPI000EAE530F|nr:DUF4302 domain-containing protein [Tenacibaculum discolor]RLK03027.1 uncharacterized protein DUF4302 [Tenacibaculum discolor]